MRAPCCPFVPSRRISLRKNGQILNSAVILFGKESVFGYPQRKLRLARFKGTDKTEFLDNRQQIGRASCRERV